MPKKPSKSTKDAAKRIAEPPRSRTLSTPATPPGYRAPQPDRPKGATPFRPEPMTPMEAKAAAKRSTEQIQRELDAKRDPLRHITPLLLDESRRIWKA